MSEKRAIVKAFKTFDEIRKDHPDTAASLDRMLEENPSIKDQLFLFQNQSIFVIDPSKIEKTTTEGEIIFRHMRGGFPVKDISDPIDQEILAYINKTPELLSLLYDLNLLPEQTMDAPHQWIRTVVITNLFRKAEESKGYPESCWVNLEKQAPLEESNYDFLRPDGSILRLEGVTFKSKTVTPISK
jgi:hypothetical protein